MGVYTSVRYDDLLYEKRQELIDRIKSLLLEKFLKEGEEILKDEKRKWFVKPRTKEEAYCRIYDIGSNSWSDLEEKSQEFKDFDWTYELTEYAQEKAELNIVTAFKYVEVEIDLD